MTYANLHTHSDFSDGLFPAEEMLKSAIGAGLCSYGLSDHSDTLCDPSYCMKTAQYPEYLRICAELKKKYEEEIAFFCGLEKDFYSEIDYEAFDYTIGSVHYICVGDDCYPIDHTKAQQEEFIEKIGKGNRMELAKRYYALIAEHAQKGKFDVQGHFDVIAKFGLFDDAGEEYEKVALEALREVLEYVPFVELNTGAVFKGLRKEAYPADFLLSYLYEHNGQLILNSDAHHTDAVRFFFDESCARLRKFGFTSLWQLRRGGFGEIKL